MNPIERRMTEGSDAGLRRRSFLKAVGAGGALFVGFGFTPTADAATATKTGPDAAPNVAINAFVRIGQDNGITIMIPSAEMGQGVSTALAMVVAEELDVDWKSVRTEFAPSDSAYKNLLYGMQLTGGSTTVRSFWEPLSKTGAAAREMLVNAAALQWKVKAESLTVANGQVSHAASKRSATYGQLAAAAAKQPVPVNPRTKDPSQYKLVGKRVRRLDTADKVTGRAVYGMDTQLPGLLVASIALPAVRGSKVKAFDPSAAMAVQGVVKVVQFSDGVAVLAKDFWTAKKGRDALVEKIDWELSDLRSLDSETLRGRMVEAGAKAGLAAEPVGDAAAAFPNAAKIVESEYHIPYIAHACMEPMNATAWVRPDSVEVWAPTQFQFVNADQCAKVGGVKPEQVKVHTTFLGGGFGRRFGVDFVQYALEVSKAAGAPVRLIYAREDDMKAHFYRPAQFTRMKAGLDAEGNITAISARVVSSSIWKAAGFPLDKSGMDAAAVEGLHGSQYSIPNKLVEWVQFEPGPHVWFWRSVGHSQNGFINECFMDELADAAGQDAVQFRLRHLKDKPRHRAVLETVASKAGWGTALPAGHARGVAIHESFETIVAHVAEVSADKDGVKVHRFTSVVDLGRCINPATVEAQVQSSIATGLSQALHMKITFKDGQVQQSNFHDHPVLRLSEMPKVDVTVIVSDEKPGGMGEPATPPVAPAVANALSKLTGLRQREMPLQAEIQSVANTKKETS